MSDLEKLGKNLTLNYVNLLQGRFISHIIGFIGSILVIRILEPTDYGILSIAMSLPYTVSIFGNLGVNTAVTRFVAKYKEIDLKKAYSMIASGIIFDVIYGLLLSVIGYLLTPYIVTYIYNKPEIIPYSEFASFFTIPYWASSSIFSGILGLELTKHNSEMWIIHYSVQTILSVGLALSFLRVYGVIISYIIGYTAIVIYGIVILKRKSLLGKPSINTIKELVVFGFPLVLPSLGSSVSGIYTTSLVNRFLSIFEISNLTASSKLGTLFDTILNPLSYALQPTLSKLDKNKHDITKVTNELYKLNIILQLPILISVEYLAYQIIYILAGTQYTLAPLLLRLSLINPLITTAAGASIINSLLLFQGYSKLVARINLINIIFYVLLLFFLLPNFSYIGYFISNWLGWIPGYIISLSFVKKNYNYKLPIKDVMKIYLVTSIFLLPVLFVNNIFGIVLDIFLVVISYKIYVKIKVINQQEINIILSVVQNSSLNFIAGILKKILS
ncbi:MAG: oligosaccharide flippase family protein [Saccharolobus sp.]|uniref:oligosaccharide flippase family protein n=1 Tax=Saccharolobus TaxID=2100760 RepID=UPI001F0F5A34|nr:oligosaccharide flippase family protein [Saccharolobus shibatae]